MLPRTVTIADDPRYNNARAPAQSTCSEAKVDYVYTIQTSWLSCCAASHPFVQRALQWVRFRKPHGIPHGICFEADTRFRYSFKILPDRLKLIRLHPCRSLGQSISFVFGARVGHFAAITQSDVVGIWSRDLGVMATLSVRQKMPFFSCIYSPPITVSPTSSFSASFNENRVKNHP